MKVVKADFYLSKSTEVLALKSTLVPKVIKNIKNVCQCIVLLQCFVVCNTCKTSEATYSTIH